MADTQDPFNGATPEFLRKRADSWCRTPAIVYDSIEGRLYRAPQGEVEGKQLKEMQSFE